MEGTAVNVPANQRTCANKRAAAPVDDARNVKRVKDLFEETASAVRATEQPAPPREQTRTKRPLDDDDCMLVGERSAADAAATAAARAPVRRGGTGSTTGGEAQRILQASDLENSIAIISSALRWRSPAKPYKLARIHGPYSPPRPTTAVRGIVDVGAEADEDDPGQPGKQSDGQPQLDPATTGNSGPATRGQQAPGWDGGLLGQSQPQPSYPPPLARLQQQAAQQQLAPQQQQQEWGRLFSALSLGGGRGSQRSDPVWAAVSSNRAAGGAAARRCDASAGPDPQPGGQRTEPAQAAGRAAGPAAAPAQPPPPALGAAAVGGSHAPPPTAMPGSDSTRAGAGAARAAGAAGAAVPIVVVDAIMDANVETQVPGMAAGAAGTGAADAVGRPGLGQWCAAEAEAPNGPPRTASSVLSESSCPARQLDAATAAVAGMGELPAPPGGSGMSGTMDISPVKAAPGFAGPGGGQAAGRGGGVDAAEGGGPVRSRPRGGFLAQEASRLLAGASGPGRMSA